MADAGGTATGFTKLPDHDAALSDMDDTDDADDNSSVDDDGFGADGVKLVPLHAGNNGDHHHSHKGRPPAPRLGNVSSSSNAGGSLPWVLRLAEAVHPRLHYGHLSVVLAGITFFLSAVGATYGVGYFTEALMASLGISRSVVSLCWTGALLASAVVLPLVGRAVDRFGLRKVMALIAVPYALSLVWLGSTQSVVEMVLAFFILRLVMAVAQLASNTLVSIWWVKYRGKALGAMNMIATLNIAFPSIQTGLNEAFGWRGALYAEAVMIIVFQSIIGLMFLNHPERYNRFTDGATSAPSASDMSTSHLNLKKLQSPQSASIEDDEMVSLTAAPSVNATDEDDTSSTIVVMDDNNNSDTTPFTATTAPKSDQQQDEEVHWHWKDALRAPMFWAVSFASCMCMLVWSGFNFHYESIFEDSGLPGDTVHFVFLPVAVTSAVGMILVGIMFDRMKRRQLVMAIALILLSLGVVVLVFASNKGLAIIFGILFGFMNSFYMLGNNSLMAQLFGRAHLGFITSVNNAIVTVAVGLGPSLFGLVREQLGSYTPMLVVLGVLSISMAVLICVLPKPKTPPRDRLLQMDSTPL